jgi:hypothetical protein
MNVDMGIANNIERVAVFRFDNVSFEDPIVELPVALRFKTVEQSVFSQSPVTMEDHLGDVTRAAAFNPMAIFNIAQHQCTLFTKPVLVVIAVQLIGTEPKDGIKRFGAMLAVEKL